MADMLLRVGSGLWAGRRAFGRRSGVAQSYYAGPKPGGRPKGLTLREPAQIERSEGELQRDGTQPANLSQDESMAMSLDLMAAVRSAHGR